jgi:hypothetical protein
MTDLKREITVRPSGCKTIAASTLWGVGDTIGRRRYYRSLATMMARDLSRQQRPQTILVRSLGAASLGLCTALVAAPLPAAEQAQLQSELDTVRQERDEALQRVEQLETADARKDGLWLGPLRVGGAMRVNFIEGDYDVDSDGPSRGTGNFELDTFRINMELEYGGLIGALEYRWYNGYNFLHTGWLGYAFNETSQLQVGLTRVPFGPGPYGVSQSWFFDQHYYVGLVDDMDLGAKYVTEISNWQLDAGWFWRSEPNGNGNSVDSARYGYDAVTWSSAIDDSGSVVSAPTNGYRERHQFNLRAIRRDALPFPADIGISAQYGQLEGEGLDDGDRWALSLHMVNAIGALTVASEITRYEVRIDDDNPWGTDALFPSGAFDFAWLTASRAWLPALSISYLVEVPGWVWLDSVLPYLEYSSIVKDESSLNDSQMLVAGAAWASGGWYIYTDLAWSNGNLFVGNEGDDYAFADGVGDWGVNGNDRWNYRFNLNLGYYF